MSDVLDAQARRNQTLFRDVFEQLLKNVHTSLPARVERYDAAQQLADCVPLVKNRVQIPDGTYYEDAYPVIPDVPVAWPRGGGAFLHLPLAAGDLVLLHFSEQAWEQARRVNDVASPLTGRRHDLADAIATPLSIAAAPLPVNGDDARFGNALGSFHVRDDGTLALGATSSPAGHVAVAEAVAAKLNALAAAISAAPIVPSDGGASFKAALVAFFLTAPWNTSVAASKLLVDP